MYRNFNNWHLGHPNLKCTEKKWENQISEPIILNIDDMCYAQKITVLIYAYISINFIMYLIPIHNVIFTIFFERNESHYLASKLQKWLMLQLNPTRS